MNNKRDFKGIWIPAEIWLSDKLTLQEKVFLVEISSLDNEEGCYANNAYFADFFGISKTRVSIVINKLVEKNYITSTIFYKEGSKQILKRVLKVCYIGYARKVIDPIQGKFKDSNTFNNTNSNTFIKEKEEKKVFPPSPEDNIADIDIKEPAPKRKKKPTLSLIWPASFTSNVINLLTEYMEMRKQIGKAMTSQLAFTKMVNACEKIAIDYGGEQVLVHSINSAIAAQWLSIYPKPLQGNNGKPHQHAPVQITDRDLFDKLLTIKCTLQNLRIYPKHLDSLEGEEKLKAMQTILETHKNKRND
jgi:hypothetical protein